MELLSSTIFQVFLYALLTAVATGIGAVPFFFIKDISPSLLGKSNAVASGLMLAASFSLIMEGYNIDQWMTLSGMLAGVVLVVLANKWMEDRSEINITDVASGKRMAMLMFLGIMTVHSFAEGVSVGVSFASTMEFGVFIAIEAIEGLEGRDASKDVELYYDSFGGSSVDFKLRFWIKFDKLPQYLGARSEAMIKLKKAFDENDIMIPYPITTLDFGIRGGEKLDSMLKNGRSSIN